MKLKEIFTIFMDYSGKGIYPFLFLAALIYLLATEKNSKYAGCFWNHRW